MIQSHSSRILILCLLLPLFAFAQNKYTVSGTVLDDDGKMPLEYATITFIDPTGETSDQGGITDRDGHFSVEVKKGTYDIKVEYISFTPKIYKQKRVDSNIKLGTVGLKVNSDNLDAVVVRSQTTQVDIRLDKKIYNIGKDLTTQGASVSDALSNVPSVTVDLDGAISLRGNENVRILVNGKPSAMAGFGDTNIFQQLPADAIEKVEVITSPSARYEAEGTAGILNIILKKEKTLGFNGSISASVGHPLNSSLSASVNLRSDKFNIFNTTGIKYQKAPGTAFFDNRYENGNYDRILEDRDYDRVRKGINTNLGMEYFLTEASSITGSVFLNFGDHKDIRENNTTRFDNELIDSKTLRRETEQEDDNTYQFSLNYENKLDDNGQKLTADLQYSYNDEYEPSTISERGLVPTNTIIAKENIYNTEIDREFLAKADYVLPMGDAQFEAGFKSNFEHNVTDYQLDQLNLETDVFETNTGLTNKFTYDKNVNAVYSQYGNKFGDFSFLLGLRLENTQLKGKVDSELSDSQLEEELGIAVDTNFDKNYFSLFPTVNLIYELQNNENFSLGYNRRINRPWSWFINPFPSRSSTTNIFQGNPDLDPSFSNAFDLGYLRKWDKLTLTSSVYYQHETGALERVRSAGSNSDDDGSDVQRIISLPINLSTEDRYGAELGLLYNPADWLRMNGSFNFYRSVSEGEYDGKDYGSESSSWFGRFSAKVKLPGKIDWQTNAYYRGPRKNSQTKTDGIFSMNLAFSKEVIEDKLTASINVSDVFNSRKRNSYTIGDNYSSESEFQWRRRQVTATLIYRFNQPKNQRNSQHKGGNGDFGGEQGGFEG